MKNDKEIYMPLKNLQQVGEQVEVYYECLFKLANYLQLKAIDVFLTTIFRICLQSYLKLVTTSMTRDTLIKHKEVVMIFEESGPIIANYNVFIIQLESKPVAHPIVIFTTIRQQLTCSNCGKTSHAKKMS